MTLLIWKLNITLSGLDLMEYEKEFDELWEDVGYLLMCPHTDRGYQAARKAFTAGVRVARAQSYNTTVEIDDNVVITITKR